jgi:hypothetical protein
MAAPGGEDLTIAEQAKGIYGASRGKPGVALRTEINNRPGAGEGLTAADRLYPILQSTSLAGGQLGIGADAAKLMSGVVPATGSNEVQAQPSQQQFVINENMLI